MLSNLWKALWGNKQSIEQTRQDIERSAQQLSQFNWNPENRTTPPPPPPPAPEYATRYSFSVQSRPPTSIYQDDGMNERGMRRSQATYTSLPRVRSRQDEDHPASQRKKRRRAAKKQRRERSTSDVPSEGSLSTPQPQQQTTASMDETANTASSSSSSNPQQPSSTISRAPVYYPHHAYSTNEHELKHVIHDMLSPAVWNTLNGDIVQQWIEVPYVIPNVEALFGRNGRLMQLIQEKATGVDITVEFPRIVLKGPQFKVNRIADTVNALITPFGRKKQGSINLLCTGPQLASKVAKWKEHVGDVIDVLVNEDMVRISVASVVVNKNAKVTLDQIRDELLHLLGTLTPEQQPESFICNDYQLLSRVEKKTTMIVSPDRKFGLGKFIDFMSGHFEQRASMHTPHRPKITVLKSKTRLVPKANQGRSFRKMKKETIHPPSNLKDLIPADLLADFFGHLDVVGVDLTFIFRPRIAESVEIPVTYQGLRIF